MRVDVLGLWAMPTELVLPGFCGIDVPIPPCSTRVDGPSPGNLTPTGYRRTQALTTWWSIVDSVSPYSPHISHMVARLFRNCSSDSAMTKC